MVLETPLVALNTLTPAKEESMSIEQSTVIYRTVPNFPDYRVGSDGSFWSRRHRRIPGGRDGQWRRSRKRPNEKTGYYQVELYPGPVIRSLHRLVLEIFVGPCPDGMECCHNDGNRSNNVLSNLRWDTKQANQADSERHGTRIRGDSHPRAKLTADMVRAIRAEYAAGGVSYTELARKFRVSKPAIRDTIKCRYWTNVV